MAATRSERQLAEIGRFVEDLFEVGGYGTWKEFADDARISQGQISEFKNGVTEPSGYNLLRLIQVAAARASAEPHQVALRSRGSDRLGEIQAGVSALLAGQAELLASLDEARSREEQAQKRTAPRRKAASKKGP